MSYDVGGFVLPLRGVDAMLYSHIYHIDGRAIPPENALFPVDGHVKIAVIVMLAVLFVLTNWAITVKIGRENQLD